MAAKKKRNPGELSPREKEIVDMMLDGKSTREIAEEATLTVATVHTYKKRIYKRLGVHSDNDILAAEIDRLRKLVGKKGAKKKAPEVPSTTVTVAPDPDPEAPASVPTVNIVDDDEPETNDDVEDAVAASGDDDLLDSLRGD